MKNKIKKVLPIILLIIITFIICLLSYDNPFAKVETGTDSKVFRQIVNIMNHGGAPYKDGFDHKGPILYIIDWIGVNISFANIDGIWIMQLVAIFVTVFFTYKILTKVIKLNNIESILLDFIININIIFFLEEGNLVETYALPIITITLYLILTLNSLNYKKSNFLIGLFMAIVCFLRVNMIAIWIVYYLFVLALCLKQKKYKQLVNIIKYAFLGAFSIALIVGLYLIISGSLKYCIEDYLLFNIKYAVNNNTKIWDVLKAFVIKSNICLYCIIILSFVLLFVKKEKFQKWFSVIYFILSAILVLQPRNEYLHYATIMIPTYIMPISYAYKWIKNIGIENKNKTKCAIKYLIILGICSLLLYIPIKSYYTIFKKVNMTVPDLNELVNITNYIKENSNESDKILVVGNDCDIYTLTDRKPASRYMYQYPIFRSNSNILQQVSEDIQTNKARYIIVEKICEKNGLQEFIQQIVKDKYKQIQENKRYKVYERQGE